VEAAAQPQELNQGLASASVGARSSALRANASWWVLPGFLTVVGLAAVTYLYNLQISGYANTYYSMAAQAASLDWKAWFFGSLDPANFITIDKPPLATMLMGLSVRLFGLSSWAILLPQALAGIGTVAVLYAIVRRQFGPAAATIAAFVTAMTPVAVLMFRFDNPDALLTFLLVAAGGAFWRAMTTGRLRWVVLSAVIVGFAFNTKFLQAYLVLPAFALTYLIAAQGTIWRRLGHLLVALGVVIVSSSWWVAAVELTPAVNRPYIGGSGTNSALELLVGYDGLERIFGLFGFLGIARRNLDLPFGLVGTSGGGFAGEPGMLRLFNTQFAGEVAWLIPFALVALVVGLVARGRAPRTDLRRAAYLFWGLWLIVTGIVFSYMSGIIHTYYAVALAPAIGALAGAGTVELWSAAKSNGKARFVARAVLAAAVVVTSLFAVVVLGHSPLFMPWLAPAIAIGGVAAAIGILIFDPRPSASGSWPKARVALASGAAAVALVAMFAGPVAFAVNTASTAHRGGDPQAGPPRTGTLTATAGPGVPGGSTGPTQSERDHGGLAPNAGAPGTTFGPGLGIDSALAAFIEANRGNTRWAVAVKTSNEAANFQLTTGMPVMTMGGFNGSDQTLTIDQMKAYVATGALRFVLLSGPAQPQVQRIDAGFTEMPEPLSFGLDGPMKLVLDWVREYGTVVYTNHGNALFDLSGVFAQ